MNKALCGVLLVSVAMWLSSCSLQQRLTGKRHKAPVTPITDTTGVNAKKYSRVLLPAPDSLSGLPDTAGTAAKNMAMVLPVWGKKMKYATFAVKAKVHFESPGDKQDFTANIRIKKDTAIWVHISALGGMVEAARVYITPDSLFMINYLQKEYSRISLEDVAKILPTKVDFSSLQNLITGEPLRGGDIKNVVITATSWLLQVQDSSYMQKLTYAVADTLLKEEIVTTIAPGPVAALKYDAYEPVADKKIATVRTVTIESNAEQYLLEMDLRDMEFDQPVEMPFRVPKNYTKK